MLRGQVYAMRKNTNSRRIQGILILSLALYDFSQSTGICKQPPMTAARHEYSAGLTPVHVVLIHPHLQVTSRQDHGSFHIAIVANVTSSCTLCISAKRRLVMISTTKTLAQAMNVTGILPYLYMLCRVERVDAMNLLG